MHNRLTNSTFDSESSRNGFCFLMLLLYLFFILIRVHEYTPAFDDIPVMPILLGTATFAWLFNKREIITPSQHILVPLLTVYMFLTTAIKIGVSESIDVFSNFYPVAILYFLIVSSVTKPERFVTVFRLMIIAAVIMSLHGIQQTAQGIGWTGMDMIKGRIRYIGIFNDPNDTGLYFLVVLPMLVYMTGRANLLMKPLYLACIGIVLYGIYLTESRGTTLGLGVLIALFFYRKFGLLFSALFAGACLIALIGLDSRISAISTSEASAFQRVDAWKQGYFMTRDNPVLGVGVGGFVQHHHRVAHNSWVHAMGELGIAGYFIWNGIVFTTLLMVYKLSVALLPDETPAEEQNSFNEFKKISVVFLYSFAGFCFAAFFLSRSYNIVLFAMCGLITANYVNMKARWPSLDEVKFSNYAGSVLVFSCVSVIGFYLLAELLIRIG